MSWAFRNSSHNSYPSGTTAFFISKPTGVVDGDLLVVAVPDLTGGGVIATPSGWTAAITSPNFSVNIRLRVFWKIAASEPSGWTFSTAGSSIQMGIACVAYSGISGTPLDVSTSSIGTGANPTCPTVTTTTTNDLVVFVAAAFVSGSQGTFTGVPTGYTARELNFGSNPTPNLIIGDGNKATAGATGTIVLTNATVYNGWGVATLTFKQASSGALSVQALFFGNNF